MPGVESAWWDAALKARDVVVRDKKSERVFLQLKPSTSFTPSQQLPTNPVYFDGGEETDTTRRDGTSDGGTRIRIIEVNKSATNY
jgi:hypothetical protein